MCSHCLFLLQSTRWQQLLLSFGRTEQMEEWATKVDQVTEQQPEAPRTPQ